MPTVISLTKPAIMELMAGWESVADQQSAIDAAVADLSSSVASFDADLTNLHSIVLPALEADLAAGSIRIDELNDTILPNLQATLDAHNLDLINLNTVHVPSLQEQITSNSNWILELNETTLPGLQVILDANVEAITTLEGKFPIEADDIQAGTITANEIEAGTITAVQIAAGTITANEIAADTITANEIAAGTITASEIAAGAITAEEIAAGSITTDKIAAGAVTAEKVSAEILVANAVYGRDGYFGTVKANQIVVGDLTAAVSLSSEGSIVAQGVGGERVSLSGTDGFLVSGPDSLGNPDYVSFPTDGRPNVISTMIQAKTITVEGDEVSGKSASFRLNSQLEPGATLVLNAYVVSPITAPIMTSPAPIGKRISPTISPITAGAAFNPAGTILYAATMHNSLDISSHYLKQYTVATDSMEIINYDFQMISGSADWLIESIATLGTKIIALWRSKLTNEWAIASHPITGAPADTYLNLGAAHYKLGAIASDGTDVWLASVDGSMDAVRFRRYLGNFSSATVQETVTTELTLPESSGPLADELNAETQILNVLVGSFDFGARKFIIDYKYYDDEERVVYESYVGNTSGAYEPLNEWQYQAGGITLWDGTVFWEYAEGWVWKYTPFKLSGRTQTFYANSTFYQASLPAESSSSPQVMFTAYSRWSWRATVIAPPANMGSRLYMGTASGVANSKLQQTLAVGAISATGVSYNAAGISPPGSSGFASTRPASIHSQATIDLPVNTTTVAGSATLSGIATRFRDYLVGRIISGPGIPVGTTIVSVESWTSLTMSANATAASTEIRSITVPKLEIRGDAYARITELESVILNSTSDVNVLPGNTPPLRIGDIAGTHMRLDGNEIQVMSSDDVPANLILQQGGGSIVMNGADSVSIGGKTITKLNWDSTTISTNASGEDTIAHGLGGTPAVVVACMASIGELAHKVAVTTWSATNFTVKVRRSDTNAFPANGTSIQVRWFAIR